MRVLHISTSPRGDRSVSIAVANAFLGALEREHDGVEIDLLDVWDEGLPEFDRRTIEAKYKAVAGEPLDDEEQRLWDWITRTAKRFAEADRIVIGLPMWNWAYPYKFKQLIDLVSQRGLLFSFDGTRFGPALDVERALVIAVRGQYYDEAGTPTPASEWDHQTAFPVFFLRTVGVRDVQVLTVEHTWDDQREAAVAAAKREAEAIAADF